METGWGVFSSSTEQIKSLADKRVESPEFALTTVSVCLLKQHVFHGQQQILKYRNIASADLKKWREMERCHPGKTLQTRGDLGSDLTKKRSVIPPAHQHTSLFCPTVPQNISLREQTVDAISHLEGGPGSAEAVPCVTWQESSPVTAKSPP